MESSTCVVDGQQRLNAIREFVSGKFSVEGRFFSDLSVREKEDFYKYEVPVIDFDLDAGDPNLKEVFKRLNRAFYSLSTIERLATEFSASQFMLVARLLTGDIVAEKSQIELALDDVEQQGDAAEGDNTFLLDPGIEPGTWQWLVERTGGEFSGLISDKRIFSYYEAQRKVPLMFVLNVMCTAIGGYYNRNAKVKEYLEICNDYFEGSEDLIINLNAVGRVIKQLDLPDSSMWWNKANFFTMTVELERIIKEPIDVRAMACALTTFEKAVPADYALAAREAVNDRNQRMLRGKYFRQVTGLEPMLDVKVT